MTKKSAKMKIKKGDLVQVLAGKDKAKQGRVISVDTENQRVVVEGVNRVVRHTKPGLRGQSGGLVTQEASIHVSNVAVLDPEDKKPTRIKTRVETVERDGGTKASRSRVAVRSGKDL